MAITFINGSHVDDAGETDLTPSEPTNTAENDLILAFVMWTDTSNTIVDPDDFTQIDNFTETVGPDREVYAGRKIRGSTAGDGYTFSVATVATCQASLLTFRGIDTTTPLDVTYVKANHYTTLDNTPNLACKAITTANDNSLVVVVQIHTGALSDTDGSPPSGYAEVFEAALGQNNDGFYAATKLITSAATETPGVFTHTDTNNTSDPRNFTFALRLASANTSIIVPTGPWY